MTRVIPTLLVLATGCFFKPDPPSGGVQSDAGGDGDSTTPFDVLHADNNFVFITSQRWTGTELSDPAVADAKCAAAAAGTLTGTYRAWVSSERATPFVHASTRLGSARGWVRPDGLPFADTVADIVAGTHYYPPRIDENGNDAFVDQEFVFTGTDPDGLSSGNDCHANGNPTMGVPDATGGKWTALSTGISCSNLFHLYCFGIDKQVPVAAPPAPPAGAMRAFVSTPVGVMSSAGDFDTHCQDEAVSAGLPGGTYVAIVARNGISQHSVLPSPSLGWYRVDNVKIADDNQFPAFHAPLNVTAAGAHVLGEVFSGAANLDTTGVATDTCNLWASNSSSLHHSTGDVERSERGAFTGATFPGCDTMHRLYCLQID